MFMTFECEYIAASGSGIYSINVLLQYVCLTFLSIAESGGCSLLVIHLPISLPQSDTFEVNMTLIMHSIYTFIFSLLLQATQVSKKL